MFPDAHLNLFGFDIGAMLHAAAPVGSIVCTIAWLLCFVGVCDFVRSGLSLFIAKTFHIQLFKKIRKIACGKEFEKKSDREWIAWYRQDAVLSAREGIKHILLFLLLFAFVAITPPATQPLAIGTLIRIIGFLIDIELGARLVLILLKGRSYTFNDFIRLGVNLFAALCWSATWAGFYWLGLI